MNQALARSRSQLSTQEEPAMETTQVVLRGTVQADGTLALDGPLEFPAGPVEVTVRAVPAPAVVRENWLQCILRMRAELEAEGHKFMNDEEMQSYIDKMHREDTDINDEIERRMEAEKSSHGAS